MDQHKVCVVFIFDDFAMIEWAQSINICLLIETSQKRHPSLDQTLDPTLDPTLYPALFQVVNFELNLWEN